MTIDETTLTSLAITAADWRSLPRGYVRRRMAPLAIVAALCLGFSGMHLWDGFKQINPAEVQKGLKSLVLLLIPTIIAFIKYLEIVIDLKTLKAVDLAKNSASAQSPKL